jgi:Uma2 family endonuclease
MTVGQQLLTAEEYRLLPDSGKPTELVRGKVVEMSVPAPRHGYYCGKICRLVGNHTDANKLGRVMTNDSAVVTEREPDTVRGADVSFYSYERLPRGPLPEGYLEVAPELVFEVKSPGDRWVKITAKVAEYLDADVKVVCVLDPQTATLVVYAADEFPRHVEGEDEFMLPDLLGDFRVPAREFLE